MIKPPITLAHKDCTLPDKGPGRPRSRAADEAILRAALKVFIEDGIEGASIEQIADRAGVARTTVYRRWSSKEKLIAQAIASARGEEERWAADRAKFSKSPEPLIDALAAVVTRPDYQRLAARLIGSVPSCPELMEIYWRNYLLPRRTAMRRVIESARKQGIVRLRGDPEVILDLISGAVVHHLLVRPGRCTRGEMYEYLVRVLRELSPEVAHGRHQAK